MGLQTLVLQDLGPEAIPLQLYTADTRQNSWSLSKAHGPAGLGSHLWQWLDSGPLSFQNPI